MKIRTAVLFLMVFLFSGLIWAQNQTEKTQSAANASLKAVVVEDGALVFQGDNFDTEPLAQLAEGTVLEVSKKEFGEFNFHRVRLKDGRVGYMADNDLKILGLKTKDLPKDSKKQAEKIKEELKEEQKKLRPFASASFYGFSYDYVKYRENTLGVLPTTSLNFYGFKILGPDLLMEGEGITEFNASLAPTAPTYYQTATGNAANGFVFHMDALLQFQSQQSRRVLTHFGFGPMFRYSHFQAGLNKSPGTTTNYSLDDMTLGACFDLGLGVRISSWALRLETKYFWETTQYWGLGAALLLPL